MRPGQRLVERELVEALEVSRTTVREALRSLTAEGLVTVVAQRGAFVSAPSPGQAADLYAVRASLEHLVVERFVERATDADVERLRAALDAYAAAAETEPMAVLIQAKDDFYEVLARGARSDVLESLLERIQGRVRALRPTSLGNPGRVAASITELRGVVDAITVRDAERAARLCAEHVRTAASNVLSTLEATQTSVEVAAPTVELEADRERTT